MAELSHSGPRFQTPVRTACRVPVEAPQPERGLRPVPDLELGQHVGDVVLHGLQAQAELAGDLGVAEAPRDQGEHLGLARGERRTGGRSLQQPRGEPRPEHGTPGGDRADRRQHLVLAGVLEHVAARPDPQRGGDAGVVVQHREHQDGALWRRGHDPAGGLEPRHGGRLRSISTTSGRSSSVRATAASPSAASPDHLDAGHGRRAARPGRRGTTGGRRRRARGSCRRLHSRAAAGRSPTCPRLGQRPPRAPPISRARSRMPGMPEPGARRRRHRRRRRPPRARGRRRSPPGDPAAGGAGVPDDVGERLLGDAVGRDLDRRRAAAAGCSGRSRSRSSRSRPRARARARPRRRRGRGRRLPLDAGPRRSGAPRPRSRRARPAAARAGRRRAGPRPSGSAPRRPGSPSPASDGPRPS